MPGSIGSKNIRRFNWYETILPSRGRYWISSHSTLSGISNPVLPRNSGFPGSRGWFRMPGRIWNSSDLLIRKRPFEVWRRFLMSGSCLFFMPAIGPVCTGALENHHPAAAFGRQSTGGRICQPFRISTQCHRSIGGIFSGLGKKRRGTRSSPGGSRSAGRNAGIGYQTLSALCRQHPRRKGGYAPHAPQRSTSCRAFPIRLHRFAMLWTLCAILMHADSSAIFWSRTRAQPISGRKSIVHTACASGI